MTHSNALRLQTLAGALLAAASTWAAAQEGPQSKLRTAELTLGVYRIQAELAVTPAQQMTGMMFRTTMGTHEGMLFVNEDSDKRCFWMHNTLIPLSIAFIGDDGRIVNIAEMQAKSDESHCSAKPVRYALEMNKGWFSKRSLKAGDRVSGGPFGR